MRTLIDFANGTSRCKPESFTLIIGIEINSTLIDFLIVKLSSFLQKSFLLALLQMLFMAIEAQVNIQAAC